MGQFIDSIKTVKNNYKRYDSWEQNQADERAKKEYLAKTLDIPKDKVELTAEKSKAVIRATEIMDKYSEDNCEDMEQATGIAAIIPLMAAPLIGQFGVDAIKNRKIQKLEQEILILKENLRTEIGKLKDDAPDTQLKIKNLERRLKIVSSKYPIYGLLANVGIGILVGSSFILWGNAKQKEASRIGRYQARQKDLKDIKNFVVYTPEQQKQAEEIAKNLPDIKESKGISKIIKDLVAIHKDKQAYKQWHSTKDKQAIEKLKNRNLTKEQIEKAKEDQELIVDTVKEINIKAEEYSENVENAFDTLGGLSWLFAIPIGWMINSVLKLAKVPGKIRGIISFAIPVLTSISLSTSGTMVQKEASRIGRYIARKDLNSNPARLMSYSDDDIDKAKNIKAEKQKKSVTEKISNSFSFLRQYIKDAKEYNKYKKTAHQQQEKMQKAYNQIEITDEQKQTAEKLQQKVFMAFDEIDEMSQRYSEDVEAGSEIAKTVMGQFWSLLSGGLFAFSAYAFTKGRFPASKVINTLTNIGFKKDSTIRKAINEFYKEVSKDKKLMRQMHLSILDGDFGLFLKSKKGRKLVPQYNKLKKEIKKLISGVDLTKPENIKGLLNDHLKQGIIAKWVRNLFLQSSELYVKNKLKMPVGDLSQYKTALGTLAAVFLPGLGILFAVPYMFNAWLTDIQKKAGKIGIMKAMEKIDDPKVFAD